MDDRKILESYPLPLARGYRRYRNAAEPRERHDAAYYCLEIYLKYAASIAIAHYLAGEGRDHRVNAALKGLARPSLGEWLRFLRECLGFLAGEETPEPAVASLAKLFEEKESRSESLRDLYNGLRGFRTGSPSERDKLSLSMLFEEVVAYRNRVLGHGAPLGKEHFQHFGSLIGRAFPDLLEGSPYLIARRLVAFDSLQVEGGQSEGGARIECGLVEYMSDRPIRRERPHAIPYGQEAPAKHALHLLAEDGRLVSLDPLLIAHDEDVYLLNEAEGTPEYLSYSTGARHRPSGASEAQQRLFERILGYRVDSSRLDRISEDLAPAPDTPAKDLSGGEARKLGDYRIVREVGRGAMGAVFEAVQESLGRRVALKVLPGDFALEPKRVERFRREACATARIHHPNIVPVYEVGEAEGTHFYAMEFIDGRPLDQVLEETRARPSGRKPGSSTASDPAYLARGVESLAGLAEGLEAAHRLGLVHRDVKPSNVLVDRDGRFVLVDFGLVREAAAETLTRSGEMVGTLAYMSPEQVSRSPVDARADVYSLGVTLYETLTLKTPYRGESDHEIQRAILFEEPIPPRKLNPRVHRDLETILLRALEKNPERRYQSAGDFAADLRRFLRYEPIRARPQSAWMRLARRASKHKGSLAAASVIAFLLLAVGSLVLWNGHQERLRRIAGYEPAVLQAATRMQVRGLGMKLGKGYLTRIGVHVVELRGDFQVISREVGRKPVETAVKDLGQASIDVPERPEAYYYRARGLRLLERVDEARMDLDRAIEHDAGFVPALVLRSAIRQDRGDREGAASDLTRAKGSTQTEWGQVLLAAQEGLAGGRWKEAGRAFGELIETQRGGQEAYLGFSSEAYLGRGIARLEDEDFGGAVADFEAAQAILRGSPEPTLLLGTTYYLMARTHLAEETFERLYQTSLLKDDVVLEVAAVYRAFFDAEKALSWVEKMSPGQSVRERNRCNFLGNFLNRFEEACAAGEAAVRLAPDDALAHMFLSVALAKRGDPEMAKQAGKKARSLAPENVYVRVYSAGEETDWERLERILALDPSFPWVHGQLGDLLNTQGRKAEALREHRKGLELDPKDWGSEIGFGNALFAEGDYQEAAERYCRAALLNLTLSSAHDPLHALLRRRDLPASVYRPLAGLVEKLERVLNSGADDTKLILKTLALAFIHNPTAKEPVRALKYARLAVETTGRKDPDLLGTLAEVQLLAGEPEEAILTFEEALRRPDASKSLHAQLEECRKGLLPRLVSYASVDAALAATELKPVIREGDSWRYFRGKSEPPETWIAPGFDDSGWATGPSGFGYGEEGLKTVLGDMKGSYSTLYVRKSFSIPDPRLGQRLLLSVKADDGFVAYLNGKELRRARAGGHEKIITHDATASDAAPEPLSATEISLEPDLLRPGENLLALEGLNLSLGQSSDFVLIPTLAWEIPPDPARGPRLLEELRAAVPGESRSPILAYLEGRLLQGQGNHRQAAAMFSEAARAETKPFEPLLRLAESLRAAGDPQAGESAIREALGRGLPDEKELWNLWARISLVDLKRAPADLLAGLPGNAAAGAPSASREDLRWLLERLQAGEPVRINCGGGECRSPQGMSWGPDRFFESGITPWTTQAPFSCEIRGTGDPRPYATDRVFSEVGYHPARYAVPLPPGTYRVTLHFAELTNGKPGVRCFGIRIEGRDTLKVFDHGAAGFAIAQKRTFEEVQVEDGALEVELTLISGEPSLAALEIERQR